MTAQHLLHDAAAWQDAAPLPVWLADMAVDALIDEAMLTPKPGLVDLRGSGAHRDLNWMLMCHSARALRPAFHAMAQAGQRTADARMRHVSEGIAVDASAWRFARACAADG